ncbi:uncharacterized protein N7473_006943 [Penicillium subrubescens]|uniref:uncharacterized protein n=1 Tax=Penicillium subrubescens TaxID=1316194 RepID=UPI0025455349|nr:uncharacterized protein N7473_006943 [Penicillium subrubescens]KAJ5890715.1 hypothetical protein N7473_006943 [Penicillium subrubescens]
MPSSGHIQDLSQARVIRALPVTMSQILTKRADGDPAIRALLCLGPWLEEPGRDPGPAVDCRTVPSLCKRSCGFKCTRDVDPSGPGAQSGCYFFGGDLFGAAADWEETPILQSEGDHLLDAGAAVFMVACGADQLGRFDFLVARDASTVRKERYVSEVDYLWEFVDTDVFLALPLFKTSFSLSLRPGRLSRSSSGR